MNIKSTKTNFTLLHSLFKTQNPKSKLPLNIQRQLSQSNDTKTTPNDILSALHENTRINEREANRTQTQLIKSGLNQFAHITTSLVDGYMRVGRVRDACALFDEMPYRDVVSWNVLIRGYALNLCCFEAFSVFLRMLDVGLRPSGATLVGLVSCCEIDQGTCVHGFAVKSGLDLNCRVKNSLMSMYLKFGDLNSCLALFDEIEEKTVVSWNIMINAFGQNMLFNEAMIVFKEMVRQKVEVSLVSILSVLSATANANLESIHSYIVKAGFKSDCSVITSLVCRYAQSGKVESAELIYKDSPGHNLVSLTAIISSYSKSGNISLMMEYFSRMLKFGAELDSVAVISLLHGITEPAYRIVGLGIHGYVIKTGFDLYNLVSNGLITMYSKFDDMESAFLLFYSIPEKPLISWNSVISGCVQAHRVNEAINFYSQMRASSHKPDAITVASLLSGCSQLGYLRFGEKLHAYIVRNLLEAEYFVETALIDMYTKCGNIMKAERVFNSITDPCLETWNTMISGYGWYGLERKALHCYDKLRELGLKPNRITFLCVLAACTHGGLVHEARTYFHSMTEDFGLAPSLQHYTCLVGVLARGGLFDEAISFIQSMKSKTEPDYSVWGALLCGCCIHQEVKLGEYVAKKMYLLDYKNSGVYVLMSNLYAIAKRWNDVARVRLLMREIGGDGCLGVSQVETTSLHETNTHARDEFWFDDARSEM